MSISFNQQFTQRGVNSSMKFYYLITFLLLNTVFFAQKHSDPIVPYSYCNWDNTILNKAYIPTEQDSCLFVVSTRNFDVTKKEFLDYDYDTTATLKYFAIYFKGNSWTVVPYSSLENMLQLKPTFRNLVIFTEGLGKTFTSGVDRATTLMRLYEVDELFFDWPTERPYMKPGKNIKATCQVAPQVAIPYAHFLEEFQTYKTSHAEKFQTVTLFFHSMGNLLLMYDLQKNLYQNLSPRLVNNVILNAACVNQAHHKAWLDNLNFCEAVYVTINDGDRNLRGARLIFGAHQLGERPLPEYSKTAKYVDFSDVLNKEHNYFLMPSLLKQKPYLKTFYATIFEGKNPPLKFLNPEINEEVRKYLPEKNRIGVSSGL